MFSPGAMLSAARPPSSKQSVTANVQPHDQETRAEITRFESQRFTKVLDSTDLFKRKALRQQGPRFPEIGFHERSGFDLVVRTLDDNTARIEAGRCLQCDELCWVCVTVCPNRANIAFTVEPKELKIQQVKRAGKRH